MSEWISLEDRAPHDWQYVVAADVGRDTVYCAFVGHYLRGSFHPDAGGLTASNYDGGADICMDSSMTITHWMPLPAPPESK